MKETPRNRPLFAKAKEILRRKKEAKRKALETVGWHERKLPTIEELAKLIKRWIDSQLI